MSTGVKSKNKVNLKKSEEQLEAKHKRELQTKKKKVIRITLITVMILFVLMCIVLIVTGNSFTEYNMFFDYIFKLICVILNVL